MAEAEREELFRQLRRAAGVDRRVRPSHRPMTADELRLLASGELVEIGSHTLTHPALAGLPPALQKDEIRQGKSKLEEIVGRTVTSFAYPIGRRVDYTDESVALVRDAGFRIACSNFPGVVEPDTDPWQLPRVRVQDLKAEDLERTLRWWFSGGD